MDRLVGCGYLLVKAREAGAATNSMSGRRSGRPEPPDPSANATAHRFKSTNRCNDCRHEPVAPTYWRRLLAGFGPTAGAPALGPRPPASVSD